MPAPAATMLKAEVDGAVLNMVRISLARASARQAPDPPAIPKQQRVDSIAATVLELTGWTSVDSEMTGAIYRWLFGDEALFRGRHRDARRGRAPDAGQPRSQPGPRAAPETGELVLITREEILRHAEADQRVLDAARRYSETQARWHGRLLRALRPYGDRSTSVGEAVRRAAQDLGIDRAGRSFEEFAGLVMAAAKARDGRRLVEQPSEVPASMER